MFSTRYIILFIVSLTAVAAVALAALREATMPQAIRNEEIFNKRAILAAVNDYLGEGKTVKALSDAEVMEIFDGQIEQVVIDMQGNPVEGIMAEDVNLANEKKKPEADRYLPLFIFKKGEEPFYIISVRGSGLWDEIWGNIAFKSDLNTIAGASFDHKAETPGLGAEIKDNPGFPAQFEGKQILKEGEYVSVSVRKGGAQDEMHEVDAISGATVTSNGVTEMLYRGIKNYQPYFETLRKAEKVEGMLIR